MYRGGTGTPPMVLAARAYTMGGVLVPWGGSAGYFMRGRGSSQHFQCAARREFFFSNICIDKVVGGDDARDEHLCDSVKGT